MKTINLLIKNRVLVIRFEIRQKLLSLILIFSSLMGGRFGSIWRTLDREKENKEFWKSCMGKTSPQVPKVCRSRTQIFSRKAFSNLYQKMAPQSMRIQESIFLFLVTLRYGSNHQACLVCFLIPIPSEGAKKVSQYNLDMTMPCSLFMHKLDQLVVYYVKGRFLFWENFGFTIFAMLVRLFFNGMRSITSKFGIENLGIQSPFGSNFRKCF